MHAASLMERMVGMTRRWSEIRFGHILLALALALSGTRTVCGQAAGLAAGLILDPQMAWRVGAGIKKPTRSFILERPEEGLRIKLMQPGRGVALNMPNPLRLDVHQTPILTFVYRATGLDLADSNQSVLVFWGGKPSSLPVIFNGDLICDGEVHDVLLDLRELLVEGDAGSEALAWIDLRVRAASEGPAVFTLLDLRFEPDGEIDIPPEAQQQAPPVMVRVMDADNNPIRDAVVTLDPHTTNLRVVAKTDSKGRAVVRPAIPGLAGTRRSLRVTKEGMTATLFSDLKDVGAETELRAQLYPMQTLSGRVVDEGGKPVANAIGELWLNGLPRPTSPGRPRSLRQERIVGDADGHWTCPTVPLHGSLTAQVRWLTDGYTQDQWGGQHSGRLSMADLQGGKAVSTLTSGVEVTGVVTDRDGNPVAGARVAQGEDRFPSNAPPATTTDAAGRYHFRDVPSGKLVLTVTATGHAPELVQTEAAAGMKPIHVALKEAKAFRFRVVDPEGKPLPGISFSADTWRGLRTIPQRFKSNAKGIATWKGPNDPVQFDIFAQSRMRQEITAKPSADEKDITEIVMHGSLTVTVHANDAETGQPLKQFTVVTGLLWGNDAPQQPSWQRGRNPKPGVNGQWQQTFTRNYPFRLFRVEAEGYAPAISRPVPKDDGDVDLTFKLKKAAPMGGTLVDAEGKPVVGATVYLAIGGSRLQMRNGRVQRNHKCDTRKTDGQGRFSFPPEAGDFLLVVLTEGGYAEVDQQEFEKAKGRMGLAPWATVAGLLLVGNTPRANEEISVWMDRQHGPNKPRLYHSLQGTTDAAGGFRVERVPPGKIGVAWSIRLSDRKTGTTLRQTFDAKPGQTVTVALGGTGRPVVGRFAWPEGAGKRSLRNEHHSLGTKIDRKAMEDLQTKLLPKDFMSWDMERKKAWRETKEAKLARSKLYAANQEAYRKQRRYGFAIQGDGSFRIDNVAPGTYELTLLVFAPPVKRNYGPGPVIARLKADVTVPPLPEGVAYLDEPLDMGTQTLTVIKPAPKVGEVAPEFTVPLLNLDAEDAESALKDAKTLSLNALRGTFVLVEFWSVSRGRALAENAVFGKVWEAHGGKDHFTMVSVSLDDSPKTSFDYARKNKLAWPQAFLVGGWKADVAVNYVSRGTPTAWLIGPDGRILAAGLRGDAIPAAVAQALGGKTK